MRYTKLDSRGYEKYTRVAKTKSHGYEQLFTSASTQESNSRIIHGFSLRQVADRQKTHFKGISGHFQTLVSSGKFYLTEISFQWCRDDFKWS